jgi:hypothetical protein
MGLGNLPHASRITRALRHAIHVTVVVVLWGNGGEFLAPGRPRSGLRAHERDCLAGSRFRRRAAPPALCLRYGLNRASVRPGLLWGTAIGPGASRASHRRLGGHHGSFTPEVYLEHRPLKRGVFY